MSVNCQEQGCQILNHSLFSLGRRGTILTAKLPYTTLGSKLDFLSDM
jgi:hypothetical protein